ncbi:MAG: YjbF family lipoprotein [Gammaproteobacteria bacterium]|nr:YjbF family lipoprotein [Gammaproteobacteria bacterium]
MAKVRLQQTNKKEAVGEMKKTPGHQMLSTRNLTVRNIGQLCCATQLVVARATTWTKLSKVHEGVKRVYLNRSCRLVRTGAVN